MASTAGAWLYVTDPLLPPGCCDAYPLLHSGEKLHLTFAIWKDLALGSLLETLIVIVLAYQALKMIEATKTSLIISTKGVWTLVLAWIFLGVFPTAVQLAGGLLTLMGVWLITWTRKPTVQE